MKTKVFETKQGVALFFDEENYDYSSDNMSAIEAALKEDMSNYRIDPQAAIMAHNLMAIMQNMDVMKEMAC
jgi:hypothetical protein